MEDSKIIALYFQRSQAAIAETKNKYGPYCTAIAYNILASFEDAEECVADTYLKTWESIPPNRPQRLKGYVGRIAHNLAINRYRANNSQKRGQLSQILAELQVVSLEEPQDVLERKQLAEKISEFVRNLPTQKQKIFVLRYWYYDSITAIGDATGMKPERVKTELYRMRQKLKAYLEKEGFSL